MEPYKGVQSGKRGHGESETGQCYRPDKFNVRKKVIFDKLKFAP